jgi:hypothetical protein
MVITCLVSLISKRAMALALLVLAITKRVTGVAALLQGKTTQVGPITNVAAAPAVKEMPVAVLNACITKREA